MLSIICQHTALSIKAIEPKRGNYIPRTQGYEPRSMFCVYFRLRIIWQTNGQQRTYAVSIYYMTPPRFRGNSRFSVKFVIIFNCAFADMHSDGHNETKWKKCGKSTIQLHPQRSNVPNSAIGHCIFAQLAQSVCSLFIEIQNSTNETMEFHVNENGPEMLTRKINFNLR